MHLPLPHPRDDDFYIQMSSAHDLAGAPVDSLADIYAPASDTQPLPDHDMSLDSRRLRNQHTTEGYRDGITTGKAQHIQAGFDHGFSLGAHIGMKAGNLIGLLEGLAACLSTMGHESKAHADRLISDASRDLCTSKIFDQEYWAPDGTPRYAGALSQDHHGASLEAIADLHPIIIKWERVVTDEAKKWNLNLDLVIFEDASTQQLEAAGKATAAGNTPKQAIDW
ncbi:hypothetical protein F4778DRAFT_402005 [Xylariomycetidae sp. FL2044]|nr:hypothetical protein F4778DRAFT_402005 [Xylariomycetidae sp. FL2044]